MKKMLNTKLKDVKAITLIALVITIVVLTILAVIVLNLSLGENGIINKAKYATRDYKNSQDAEEQYASSVANEIEKNVGSYREISEDRIRQIVNEQLIANGCYMYPNGTPQELDSSSGSMSSNKTITAPGDGVIKIQASANGGGGTCASLTVGALSDFDTDGCMWGSAEIIFPCKAGTTISYRWWGGSCSGGELIFIPYND